MVWCTSYLCGLLQVMSNATQKKVDGEDPVEMGRPFHSSNRYPPCSDAEQNLTFTWARQQKTEAQTVHHDCVAMIRPERPKSTFLAPVAGLLGRKIEFTGTLPAFVAESWERRIKAVDLEDRGKMVSLLQRGAAWLKKKMAAAISRGATLRDQHVVSNKGFDWGKASRVLLKETCNQLSLKRHCMHGNQCNEPIKIVNKMLQDVGTIPNVKNKMLLRDVGSRVSPKVASERIREGKGADPDCLAHVSPQVIGQRPQEGEGTDPDTLPQVYPTLQAPDGNIHHGPGNENGTNTCSWSPLLTTWVETAQPPDPVATSAMSGSEKSEPTSPPNGTWNSQVPNTFREQAEDSAALKGGQGGHIHLWLCPSRGNGKGPESWLGE
uniref:uncharacterized protein n=1 Tax=Pristiophorus japonicus TaxID=55135 RepID=UPI00398F26A8